MNTQIELEIRKSIKLMITDFFSNEINKNIGKEQLMAISTFDLTSLAYIYPTEDKFITELQKAKNLLTNWFSIENNLNLLAIKLENLNFILIANFGLDTIKKIQNELIEALLNLKFYERHKETSLIWKLVYLKSYWKRRKKIKEFLKMKKIYEAEIRDLFDIYPCLWMIPFLAENAAEVINN